MRVRINFDWHPNLIVVLSVYKSCQGNQVFPSLPLLALEKVSKFYHAQHLTSFIAKLRQNDAFILKKIPVVVILFSTHASELSFFFCLHFIMGNVAISEEILDLESIELFFIANYLHWKVIFFLGDQSSRTSILENAYLWQKKLHFTA